MESLKYVALTILETILRVLPFPCKTGLVRIGNPGRSSPVLVTCNFRLTVERVKRALRGQNVYLLVAKSKGINVWCAAAGGHFTGHDVISVLKTSGIESLVDHRNVILPQLAATGVESRLIQKRIHWNVIWGPVYAKDIPRFIQNNFTKTPRMREVCFPLTQRIEMAAAWAFPISLVLVVALLPFWPKMVPAVIIIPWGVSFFLFLFFPLYSRLLRSEKKGMGFVFFDFGRGGFPLILASILILGGFIYSIFFARFEWPFILRWSFLSAVIVLVFSIDLKGSTPVFKSGLHEESLLKVVLDPEKCKGAGLCEDVCPGNCYDVDRDRHCATMPRSDRCVQCGACIVQCPFDALHFENPSGGILTPETVRNFKLNLIGKRMARGGKK
jgi:NAD-dependent dihydropyrimidine dehydrogenase PreA subunit